MCFWPGLCPGSRWGSSRRSPDPLVSWGGRGHHAPPSALTMRPPSPEFQPDLLLCPEESSTVTIYTDHALKETWTLHEHEKYIFPDKNFHRQISEGAWVWRLVANSAPRLRYQCLSTECITLHRSIAKLHCNCFCRNDLEHKHYTSS